MNPEIKDNINKPSHYIGTYGLEVKDVTRNFIKGKSRDGSTSLVQCSRVFTSIQRKEWYRRSKESTQEP